MHPKAEETQDHNQIQPQILAKAISQAEVHNVLMPDNYASYPSSRTQTEN